MIEAADAISVRKIVKHGNNLLLQLVFQEDVEHFNRIGNTISRSTVNILLHKLNRTGVIKHGEEHIDVLDIVQDLPAKTCFDLLVKAVVADFLDSREIPANIGDIRFNSVPNAYSLQWPGLESAFAKGQKDLRNNNFIGVIDLVPQPLLGTLPSYASHDLQNAKHNLCILTAPVESCFECVQRLFADHHQGVHGLISVYRAAKVLDKCEDYFMIIAFGGSLDGGEPDLRLRIVEKFHQEADTYFARCVEQQLRRVVTIVGIGRLGQLLDTRLCHISSAVQKVLDL